MSDLFEKSGNSIWDNDIYKYLVNNKIVESIIEDIPNINNNKDYPMEFLQWITSSQLNKITGLESFPNQYISLGTTQAMDEFHHYCAVNNFTLKVFNGEYPYHASVIEGFSRNNRIDFMGLEPGDAVIISLPFSGSGDPHNLWQWLLDEAEKKYIPIFVDMAWFGTCMGLNVDLSNRNIVAVSFSTSKGLNCGNWRSGVTFSRLEFPRLKAHNDWGHSIHLNVAIARKLLPVFGPDYIFNKYRQTQLAVCQQYDLTPSSTVHIATGGANWSEYSRDGAFNRINLRKVIKKEFRRV